MTLSATDINQAFDALSEELANVDERAEIVIVGGAALVLLFGARETTKDVDQGSNQSANIRVRRAKYR